jgi:hypothetical protein
MCARESRYRAAKEDSLNWYKLRMARPTVIRITLIARKIMITELFRKEEAIGSEPLASSLLSL